MLAIIENILDASPEQPRQPKGHGQAWVVPAGLDRVHSLARHADPPGKLRLAPAMLGPQNAQPVFHDNIS
jgi:hypothetical protein